MADLIADLVLGIDDSRSQDFYLSRPLTHAEDSRTLMFSGGVAEYFYHPISIQSLSEVLIYDDVGPLLAAALRTNPRLQKFQVREPEEMLRATVMGAASQTVTLSGSTIWTDQELLPLRNLPVTRPTITHPVEHEMMASQLCEAIETAANRWAAQDSESQIAIALDLHEHLDFATLQSYATAVVQYAQNRANPNAPIVLILERDYAQVLGQSIKAIHPGLPVIVIDQVGLDEGDFIDLGKPILDGRVVPLSVKTLVFYH